MPIRRGGGELGKICVEITLPRDATLKGDGTMRRISVSVFAWGSLNRPESFLGDHYTLKDAWFFMQSAQPQDVVYMQHTVVVVAVMIVIPKIQLWFMCSTLDVSDSICN